MRRLLLVLLAPLAIVPWSSAASAASPTRIDVIKVEGAIDDPLLSYLDEQLNRAANDGAIVVLQIDSAGALNEDGVALAQRVAHLGVPVIAWVGPAPARASGAGLLLMYASSLAAVSPGSQTGPLYPIDLAHPDRRPTDLRVTIQGWLDERGKGSDLSWRDRPLDGAEARHRDIAQVAALSIPGLLNRIDGRTVHTPEGTVVLHTEIATTESQARHSSVRIEFENLGPVKRVLHGVASPTMIYLLLVLAFAALAFELTQPGFGFAGFCGLGMLALAAYGLAVVPPAWAWLAVAVAGVGAMTLDVRLRRLGPLTALGLVAFAVGSTLAWHGVAVAIRISPWLIGGAVVASLLYYGFALTVALQSRDRIAQTQRGLVGLAGEARARLAPEGPVFVKGALWRGRATGEPIAAGTRIRVRGVDGLILRVEADQEREAAPGPSGA